jgi:hypothetical protein
MNVDQRRRTAAGVLLGALLLLLALRLGIGETLRETIQQKAGTYAAMTAPRGADNPGPTALAGPGFTFASAALALLLAGAASLAAGKSLGRARMGQWALMLVITGLLAVSAAQAANRFSAIVGVADIVAALASAWGLAVLCDDALLGRTGRQAALASMAAILAMSAGKALLQHFIEYPDLMQYMQNNREEVLRHQGIDPEDAVQVYLFMGRLNSREVNGFGIYSNVYATQSIALAGMAAALGVAFVLGARKRRLAGAVEKPAGKKGAGTVRTLRRKEPAQVPLHGLALFLVAVAGAMAVVTVPMTHSMGGMIAGILSVVVIACGGIFAAPIVARRRMVMATALGLALLGAAAVLGYGLTQHGLPTKSLLYRWQYWSGSVPMMERFPLWGTGLNNFGDYYLQYKAPSSPEDVKDPHSFFVRYAAEGGLPAAVAVGGLLTWMLWRALGKPAKEEEAKKEFAWQAVALSAVGGIAWALLRMLGVAYSDFEIMMSFLFAAFGVMVFTSVLYLLWHLEEMDLRIGGAGPTRYLAVAAVISALGMFLYEQINMALVTGPCAMLFWMILAVGDASGGGGRTAPRTWPLAAAIVSLASGAATLFFLAMPVAAGTASFNPATHEYEYVRQYDALAGALSRQDRKEAAACVARMEESLRQAIALSPRSGELYMQRIVLHRFLAERQLPSAPLAEDIRKVLSLDRANARVRLDLALPDSDLPKEERIAALEEALRFDAALPADEVKRLTETQKKEVRDKIAALRDSRG